MAVTFPRISITVDDNRGMGTQGELSTLSLGFGIHQAWIYSAMFGTTSIFQAPGSPFVPGGAESHVSLVFLISIVVFGLSLLFAAITDQKLLKFYTAKRVLVGAALLTAIGTFAVFAAAIPGTVGLIATVFAGVSTGIGSGLLLLFWGVAYSRHGAATIVVNTAVAIVIAVAIYSLALHVLPAPFSGVLTACLPLLELPLLWHLTPVSYAVRHAIPIFTPLPVKKGPFSVRLALPVLLFGFALGALRSISTQFILPSSDLTTQLLALFAGGAATVLLLITTFSIDKRSHWDFLFRPLVPFIAITLFFLPSLALENSMVAPLVLLTGYMCFEALMWVFFGEMAQEFRLSPIFVFGIGRGCLALGSLAGSLSVVDPSFLDSLTPFGEAGGAVLIMFAMVVAYALLPRVRDIKRIIVPAGDRETGVIAYFNRRAEQVAWSARREGADDASGYDADDVEDMLGTLPTPVPTPGTLYGGVPVNHLNTGVSAGGTNASVGMGGGGQAAAAGRGSAEGGGLSAAELARVAPGTSAAAETAGAGLSMRRDMAADSNLSDAERSRKSGRFRSQCETIADRYLLSHRETEVMFLLAKGHNAAYIQDKLCISKSTAKTHISHIYRKLDIHNQQELLSMVEEARED